MKKSNFVKKFLNSKVRNSIILVAAIGGITTAVVVPVVLTSQPSVTITNLTGDEIVHGDVTLASFDQNLGENSNIDPETIDNTERQAAFFLYEKEQVGSLTYQLQNLQWDLSQLNSQIETEDDETTLETLISNRDDTAVLITNLQNDEIDYNSSTFGSNYPLVLLPIDEINNRQTLIYEDQRNSYVTSSQFATRTEGENAWPNVRRSNYNGATTDAEAIEYLVYQQINSQAFSRFNFSISNQYTVEQKDSGIFTFLESAVQKADSVDSDQVFFISTDSRDVDFVELHNSIETQFANQKLVLVKHSLIAATQNAEGSTLPWSISRDTLKKLYSFIGPSQERGYSFIGNLYRDNFDDQTDTFIRLISDNGEGTKLIEGSLGLNTTASYFNVASQWADGFGLGFLATQDPNYDFTNEDKLTQLQQLFSNQESLIPGGAPATQIEAEERIDAMTDEQINDIFGEPIRDLFYNGTQGLKLAYENISTNDGIFLITSTFGIHILKVEDKSLADDFVDLLTEDLTASAENQDSSYSTTAYNTFLTNYFSNQARRLSYIVNYYGDEFQNYLATNASDINYQGVVDSLRSDLNSQASLDVASSLGDKVETWYIAQLDSELRDDTYTPEDIYQTAFDLIN